MRIYKPNIGSVKRNFHDKNEESQAEVSHINSHIISYHHIFYSKFASLEQPLYATKKAFGQKSCFLELSL